MRKIINFIVRLYFGSLGIVMITGRVTVSVCL